VADDFGSAIYTHCAPGQGTEGIGGMQFQSTSAGVHADALALIRRHLIYETPEALVRQQKPVEAFPPSFAHVHDELFATAAGVYLGREVDGPRQGNHLTHAIVTSDPASYHSVRPAQLFRAPFWRRDPESTTNSERVIVSWQPGALDAAEASRFVNSQPNGSAMLADLLAALLELRENGDQQDARRVLFISDDADPVISWLTAATMLIPQEEALRIGFKVFVTDPARSALPVIAIHPDWTHSSLSISDSRGYIVFDLMQNRWSQVPRNADAEHWARLFCNEDPYNVSDAVELAAASGLSAATARDLATTVLLGRMPPDADTEAFGRWLRTGPRALREAYGGAVVDAMTQSQDPKILRHIDLITGSQFPGRSDRTRLALLRQELDLALQCETPPLGVPLGNSTWGGPIPRNVSEQAKPEATRLVTEYLRRSKGSAFDAVLRVSAKFGVSVPLEQVQDATDTFIAYWADNPAAAFDPSSWPPDPPAYQMLMDELSRRVLHRPSVAVTIADQWWDHLGNWTPDRADVTSPLQCALLSAAMANSRLQDRLRIVHNLLHRDYLSNSSYNKLIDVLWQRITPTTQELGQLCEAVPAGTELDPKIFIDLVADAAGDPVRLPELELCASLSAKRLLSIDSYISELIEYHHWLQRCESTLAEGFTPGDLDQYLQQVPPALVAAHAGRLARSLLAVNDVVQVVEAVRILPESVAVAYLNLLSHFGEGPTTSRVAVAFGVWWMSDSWWTRVDPGGGLQRTLRGVLERWYESASNREYKEVAKLIAPLGSEVVESYKNGQRPRRRFFWVAQIAHPQAHKRGDR